MDFNICEIAMSLTAINAMEFGGGAAKIFIRDRPFLEIFDTISGIYTLASHSNSNERTPVLIFAWVHLSENAADIIFSISQCRNDIRNGRRFGK